ncbi:MAG: hypothetical protein AAF570_00975 [Bacteroidota bacterium]
MSAKLLWAILFGLLWQPCAGMGLDRDGTFSSDGKFFLEYNHGTLVLWEVASGKRLKHYDCAARFGAAGIFPQVLSDDGRYCYAWGRKEKGAYKFGYRWVLDLEKGKVVREGGAKEVDQWDTPQYMALIPGTYEYVCYGLEGDESMNAYCARYSLEGTSWAPKSQALWKCEKRKYIKTKVPHYGTFYMGKDGKHLAVDRYKGLMVYAMADLAGKPVQSEKSWEEDFLAPANGRLRLSGNDEVNFLSPDGTFAIALGKKARQSPKVYDAETEKPVRDFEGDPEILAAAKKALEAGDLEKAESEWARLTEKMKEDKSAWMIAFPVKFGLGKYDEAADLAAAWGDNLPAEFGWDAVTAFIGDGRHGEAFALTEELQSLDRRQPADELLAMPGFIEIDHILGFDELIAATRALDAYEITDEIPPAHLFKAGVGMYELYMLEGFGILREYKTRGLDQALKAAETSFTNAFNHATVPENIAAAAFAMGNAFYKTGNSLDATTWYEHGIRYAPDLPDNAWVDCAAAYIDMKNLLEAELRSMPRAKWSQAVVDDYVKINDRAQELCTAYMKHDPTDPSAPYIRAMTHYYVNRGSWRNRRIEDARLAKKLFLEKKIQIPEYCRDLASSSWEGPRPILENSSPNYNSGATTTTTKKPCNKTCGTCGGMGQHNKTRQCGSCHGTGKGGTCYRCNGEGRTYDANRRNQFVCYQCTAGRLSCVPCYGTGRKTRRIHCESCKGHGYVCP